MGPSGCRASGGITASGQCGRRLRRGSGRASSARATRARALRRPAPFSSCHIGSIPGSRSRSPRRLAALGRRVGRRRPCRIRRRRPRGVRLRRARLRLAVRPPHARLGTTVAPAGSGRSPAVAPAGISPEPAAGDPRPAPDRHLRRVDRLDLGRRVRQHGRSPAPGRPVRSSIGIRRLSWGPSPSTPAAISCSGRSRSNAHGENAASITSVTPTRAPHPAITPCPMAAPPSDRTATIANLARIRATSVSTLRIAHTRRAGHTRAENTTGSISTIT